MTDNFTDADAKALCAELGIETKPITDTFGRTHTVIDEAGMRKLADHAPAGATAAHAKVDQMLAAVRDHYGLDQAATRKPMSYEDLAADLYIRTRHAVEQVAGLAAHTGITFKTTDVVDAVERDLPADYAAPTAQGSLTRRDVITAMAEDILTEALDDDAA